MIGPGRDVQGGISTVVNNYYKFNLQKKINLKYIATMKDGNKFTKLLVMIKALCEFIFTINYDILHVHMSSRSSFYRKSIFILIGKIYRKKVIIHMHGSEFIQFYNNECGNYKKRYVRYIFGKAEKVIALSEEWSDFLKTICSKDKINVIYNSIVIPEFANKNYKKNNIVFLGRLGVRKGAYDLIDIIPNLLKKDNNLVFYLLGDGELKQIKHLCVEKGIENSVKILGWVKGKEKDEIMKNATIFVLPSYNEGMPMSILEAMGYQLPIVSTNVGGISKQVLNNINGYLINPGDKDALKSELIKLIESEELKKSMGSNSYKIINEKFNISNVINTLINLYEQVGASV